MMNKKTFLVTAVAALAVAMLCATLIITGLKPQLHKSLMLEIINVKIKK